MDKKFCGKKKFEVFKSKKLVIQAMAEREPGTFNQKNIPLSLAGWLGMLFAVFCWGLSFPLLKVALEDVEPITLAVLRYAIGAIPLVLFMVLRDGITSISKPFKEDFWFFLALGLVGITLPNILQNYGMRMTSAHLSSIIQSSGPIFTILLAVILLKEPLGKNKIIGTVIALSGSILLVTGGGINLADATLIGNLLVMLSAISYAVSSIISKKILDRYDPFTVATISMLLGTMILAVFMTLESPAEKVPMISVNNWYIIIVLALLPGSLALLVWYQVLRKSEVSRLILFIYLIPVFATAISYFYPREIIKLSTIIFAFLIVCGVVIAQYEKSKKVIEYQPPKPLP
jgi:drug/metabolite transporter (DMT)-like permease